MKKKILFKNYILVLLTLFLTNCKDVKSTKTEIKYVNAESGLNYRDKPNGKKIGKFNFNDKLIIESHSGVFQKINDGANSLNGEWVSTLLHNKKVFVFNSFLSDTKSKLKTQINAEIDSLTEVQIKKNIAEELRKSTQERIDEYQVFRKEQLDSFKDRYKDQSPGQEMLESMKLEAKWSKQSNEGIKPVKDTVVVTDEISLLLNLKSNRVFLIDAAILNFHQNKVLYHKEIFNINDHFVSTQSGTLFLRNLKNVEFIGRKQRVYFTCYRYGESLLETLDVEKFVFKNFCFYYPTRQEDLKKQEENLNKDYYGFSAIRISGGYGKFINCNINGAFLGADLNNIYNDNGIRFENAAFTNIQKNVLALNTAKNIVLNNVKIMNNDCKSIIQMKRDEGSGSHGREEISIHNSLITNNKTKKLLGFGKSFENKPLSSNVYFKNCEISNNSFQRAFLNFDYRKERNAQFNSCNINSNKIFDVYEDSSSFFLKGAYDNSVQFKKTTFKNNDWKITSEEHKKYFSRLN
ncbi:hypothetical protein M4I21_16655 [Cellulophaga sp. 20_2_10]|uniref:hypothetical protein n=1 Tax=Cellulophaga sp. 20_2_10 TaxID=2942476 RepID=UPI00201AB965|nr:hypothetical protein [Cellulophaga sp. 20_2_10]MCL5247453.1 hypothetical protein [Cellulophaga sp. 20_2_10]